MFGIFLDVVLRFLLFGCLFGFFLRNCRSEDGIFFGFLSFFSKLSKLKSGVGFSNLWSVG